MTLREIMSATSFIAMLFLVIACQDRNQSPTKPSSSVSSASGNPTLPPASANSPIDQWLGQWNGPEGTYLLLSKKRSKYVVKIQSLDGQAIYEGIPAGDRIQFKRDGKTEIIHAGGGGETGMKWLLDKKNCLIIKPGEAFCRD
jgi:hypothetical protein